MSLEQYKKDRDITIPKLIDEPIDEAIEVVYQSGIEYYLSEGTKEQKEVLAKAISELMIKDKNILASLFLKLGECAGLEYESFYSKHKPKKMRKFKQSIIDLFDVIDTFKEDKH